MNTEFSSNVYAAAITLTLGPSGGLSKIKTTLLITMDEAVDAMKRANKISGNYKPPSGELNTANQSA